MSLERSQDRRCKPFAALAEHLSLCSPPAVSTSHYTSWVSRESPRPAAVTKVLADLLPLARFGPLLLAPCSEFWGRNKVYYVSLSAFTLLHIPVALANSFPLHLVFRCVPAATLNTRRFAHLGAHSSCSFLSAFAGSAFLSVAGGTISDMFPPATIGAPMQLYS